MALVRRPSKVIGQFKGHDIILQSNEPVADVERFYLDAKEFEIRLQEGYGGVYKDDKEPD